MVSILCTQREVTVGKMLQICVSSVAELPAETFIGGEGDFIVKSKPETKEMSFIHICALTTMYKHQDVCIQATC